MTVRFWIWYNGWVKVTLRTGHPLHLSTDPHPDIPSRYPACEERYTLVGDTVRLERWETGREAATKATFFCKKKDLFSRHILSDKAVMLPNWGVG